MQLVTGLDLFKQGFHAAGEKMSHRAKSEHFNNPLKLLLGFGRCAHGGYIRGFFNVRHGSINARN